MTWVFMALAAHLVFIPGLYDSFTLPKRVYILALGFVCLIGALFKNKPLPLASWVLSYLLVSLVPILWLTDYAAFVERLGLDVAFISIFWAVATADIDPKRTKIVCIVICVLALFLSGLMAALPYGETSLYLPMGNTHYFSYLAAVSMPLYFVLIPENKWWGALGAVVVFVFFTVSRAGVVAGISGAVYVMAAKKPGKNRGLPLLALSVPALAIFLAYAYPNFDKPRAAMWQNGMVIVGENLLGIGRGQFETQYPGYANRKTKDMGLPGEHVLHPHNEFLNQLIETGVLGTVLYFSIILEILFRVGRNPAVSVPIAGALVSALIFGVFWFPLSHPAMGAAFFSLAGVLWASTTDG